VDLTSYAELAVRLVNSAVRSDHGHDGLGGPDAFRALVADRPDLGGPLTDHDLDALRLLRADLATIFTAAAEGNDIVAATELNALLVQYPVHPLLVRYDGPRWHLQLDETGSVADRYAAAAVIGLATTVAQFGVDRLGICAIASCQGAFIDASSNHSRRYCSGHAAARGNVTALRASRRPRTGYPASTAVG
jgi:predicted RNA-binding Zn ribbon-like protein